MSQLDAARRGLPSEPLLVSKQHSANMLGVCLRTITTLIATKQLPCRRIGKRTLVPYRALKKFAESDHHKTH
jgi:excisionase family DNA binding protein